MIELESVLELLRLRHVRWDILAGFIDPFGFSSCSRVSH